MAHIVINDTTPLDSYTATGGQTEFTVTFPFFTDASLKVYLTPNGQTADDATDILTLTTDYTVTGAGNVEGATKKITLTAGSYPSGATAGDTVVIRRDEPIARTSDLAAQGDFSSETYNDEQDIVIMILQQLEEALGRTLVGEVTGGPFDALSRRIINVADPTANQDAATRSWTLSQNASLFTETGIVSIAAARSLAATDQGKVIYLTGTTYALTIDPDSTYDFPDGSMILLNCNTSGNVTITRGSGVALNWFDGISVSDANRTLTVGGVACLVKRTDNTWHIWGNGGLT